MASVFEVVGVNDGGPCFGWSSGLGPTWANMNMIVSCHGQSFSAATGWRLLERDISNAASCSTVSAKTCFRVKMDIMDLTSPVDANQLAAGALVFTQNDHPWI